MLRWSIAGAVISAALMTFVFNRSAITWGSKRPQNAELPYAPRTISIQSMTRSARRGGEKEPFLLERGREALTVELPIGSKAGKYDLQLRDQADRPILTSEAVATIRDGVTSFSVRVDLSKLQPGRYKLEVRQPPWDWDYYPVVLQ